MTVCNRCGKENQDHYKFCLGCGAELTVAPKESGDVGMMKTMMADVSSAKRASPTPPGGVSPALPVGVIGYGEGGLLALYSGAADPRIGAVVVSGYFEQREGLWRMSWRGLQAALLITICESPVQPTIRVSRLWNETVFTRSAISWLSRRDLPFGQSVRPYCRSASRR